MQGGSDDKPTNITIPEDWAEDDPVAGDDPDKTQLMTDRPGAAAPADEAPVTEVAGLEKTKVIDATAIAGSAIEKTEVVDATSIAASSFAAVQDSAAADPVEPDETQVLGAAPAQAARYDATAVVADPLVGGAAALERAELLGEGPGDACADATEVLGEDRTEVADPGATEVLGAELTEVSEEGSTQVTRGPGPATGGPGTGRTGGTTGFGGMRPSGKGANLAVGDVIDQRFVLVEELGRGGMSVVYRARDTIKEEAGDANPYVALKILRGDFSLHPDAWIALQQEISKTQSLAHPHIVTVHDFKIDRDLGLPFAQMEEMRGESLQELIDRHPDGLGDPKKIQDILMAVADGLGYAHSSGIVHADLKPSNVFITEDDEIKLLDFGIARFIPGKKKARGGRDEVFGEGGLSALTPTYASPEMFAGESPLPSDDIYALGVIAVELGSGKHPFSSVLGSQKPAVAAADAGLVPERFPGLKNAQWKAIAACLRADRERRPVDGYEFLAMYRPKSLWLRALSALSVLLAIAVVVVWIQAQQKRPDIPFEELPLDLQVRIEEALDSGKVALDMRDVSGALFYYSDAFELHPNNGRAIDGHEAVVEVIMDQPMPTDQDQLRRRLQQANALLAYPALEDSSELRGYIRDLERLQLD